MQRDAASLPDILDSARLIQGYVEGSTREDLLKDVGLQDKVARRFEIIGEAGGRLSEETRKDLSDIPWRGMVDLRNVIIHEYGEVNYDRVWDVIREDLPRLIERIAPLVPPPGDVRGGDALDRPPAREVPLTVGGAWLCLVRGERG